MPRIYKRKPDARIYRKISEDILKKAHDENIAGASQASVCDKYGITRSVFQRYLRQVRNSEERRTPGGQTVFTKEMATSIVDHLLHLSEWGFPFDTFDLRMTVKRLLDKNGTEIRKFRDNLPSEGWAYSFLRRHKDRIKNRLCQNISKKRARVDQQIINEYFIELANTLNGVPPENIINYDETNLTDDPGRRRMICKRGARYPERIINGTKASTSLMLAGTASGVVLPVYVVYKSDHLWSTWVEGGPADARYNRSKSGWFDNVTFIDWFKSVALPYCRRLAPGSKKVLIGDNLSSHFSNEILRDCEKYNIAFVCLPPNATHLCQPLDVAYFAPMKKRWRSLLTEYKQSSRKNAGTVPKHQFPKLLKKLMEMPNQRENLMSGFRKCGIYPLDKTPVINRLPRDPALATAEANSSVSEVFTEHLQQLRSGNATESTQTVRRKRIDVIPGRSVSSEPERPSTSATGNEPQDEEAEFLGDESSRYSDSDNDDDARIERNIFDLMNS